MWCFTRTHVCPTESSYMYTFYITFGVLEHNIFKYIHAIFQFQNQNALQKSIIQMDLSLHSKGAETFTFIWNHYSKNFNTW